MRAQVPSGASGRKPPAASASASLQLTLPGRHRRRRRASRPAPEPPHLHSPTPAPAARCPGKLGPTTKGRAPPLPRAGAAGTGEPGLPRTRRRWVCFCFCFPSEPRAPPPSPRAPGAGWRGTEGRPKNLALGGLVRPAPERQRPEAVPHFVRTRRLRPCSGSRGPARRRARIRTQALGRAGRPGHNPGPSPASPPPPRAVTQARLSQSRPLGTAPGRRVREGMARGARPGVPAQAPPGPETPVTSWLGRALDVGEAELRPARRSLPVIEGPSGHTQGVDLPLTPQLPSAWLSRSAHCLLGPPGAGTAGRWERAPWSIGSWSRSFAHFILRD
ncbi:uncharacterized protein [Notamacropus eugenii]|uniref:uncharacterized protein n=1 Tax=Notamacropus eugenii TaxID=9315 RepID=UPI003B67BC6D